MEIAQRLKITQSAVSRFETNAKAKIEDAVSDLAVLKRLKIKHDNDPADVNRRVRRLSR